MNNKGMRYEVFKNVDSQLFRAQYITQAQRLNTKLSSGQKTAWNTDMVLKNLISKTLLFSESIQQLNVPFGGI